MNHQTYTAAYRIRAARDQCDYPPAATWRTNFLKEEASPPTVVGIIVEYVLRPAERISWRLIPSTSYRVSGGK